MNALERIFTLKGGAWADARVTSRRIDHLIGMCQGILLDAEVNREEAEGLLRWLQQNQDVSARWPGSAILERLVTVLSDDHFDSEEQKIIMELIAATASNPDSVEPFVEAPASLPWDQPEPEVVHSGMRFCLTGEFVRASRKVIAEMISSRGGMCADQVSKKTNYVVVGMYGSDEWKHNGFGTKIIKAMELKAAGTPISIVSEKHWNNFL